MCVLRASKCALCVEKGRNLCIILLIQDVKCKIKAKLVLILAFVIFISLLREPQSTHGYVLCCKFPSVSSVRHRESSLATQMCV